MSAEGMPQYIVIDISELRVRSTFFKFIGFDCWHDYKSNPAVIELLVSADGIKEYITWSTIYLEFVNIIYKLAFFRKVYLIFVERRTLSVLYRSAWETLWLY